MVFFFFALIFYDYKSRKKQAILFILLIYLGYFTLIVNKQPRFMLLFLPLIVIIVSFGIVHFLRIINTRYVKKEIILKILAGFLVIVLIMPALNMGFKFFRFGYYESHNEKRPIISEYYEYFNNYSNSDFNDKNIIVLTTDPVPSAYTDKKFIPFYYSAFDAEKYYELNINSSDAVIYNPQAFQCEKISASCMEKQKKLERKIFSENKLVFNKTYDNEKYFIFVKK